MAAFLYPSPLLRKDSRIHRVAKGILTEHSQTFVGISHYLPLPTFAGVLFPACPVSHTLSSCYKLVRSPSPENKPFQNGGRCQCPPFRVSATEPSHLQAVKSKEKPRTHQPVLPSLLQQPDQERGLLPWGSPTAVRLWKLCRLRLWNSSVGLLQLIIPAAWIPNLGL